MPLNCKTMFIINKRKSTISGSPTRAALNCSGFKRSHRILIFGYLQRVWQVDWHMNGDVVQWFVPKWLIFLLYLPELISLMVYIPFKNEIAIINLWFMMSLAFKVWVMGLTRIQQHYDKTLIKIRCKTGVRWEACNAHNKSFGTFTQKFNCK